MKASGSKFDVFLHWLDPAIFGPDVTLYEIVYYGARHILGMTPRQTSRLAPLFLHNPLTQATTRHALKLRDVVLGAAMIS